jgi:hypothetical protein
MDMRAVEMTEFELIEAMLGYQDAGVRDMMNFVSVLFAYLVCGYLVGAKLTRLQLYIVNGLFTAFSLAAALGTYVSLNRSFDLITRLIREFPSDGGPVLAAPPPAEGASVALLFIVVAYVAGVVFMGSARKAVGSGSQ